MNSDAFKCLYAGEKQTWTGHLWLLLTALMVEVCLDGSLGGPEVNTVTSCQLPPKVVSIVLSHMKGRTFEYKCMHTSELVRAPTATHKHAKILTRTFRPSVIMPWSMRPKGAGGETNLPQSMMFTTWTGWEHQAQDRERNNIKIQYVGWSYYVHDWLVLFLSWKNSLKGKKKPI